MIGACDPGDQLRDSASCFSIFLFFFLEVCEFRNNTGQPQECVKDRIKRIQVGNKEVYTEYLTYLFNMKIVADFEGSEA